MFPALRDVFDCLDNVKAVTTTDSRASAATVSLAVRQAIRMITCGLVSNYATADKQYNGTSVTAS